MADVTASWKSDMAFDLGIEGFSIPADADPEFGGRGYGPRPKGLMLTALAGCTGMDVVSILGKMKVAFDSFEILIQGETADKHPKVYTKVHLEYRFKGAEIPEAKVARAIELSLNDYCAVAATLRHTAEISHTITIET